MFVKETCTQRDICESCSLEAITFVKWDNYKEQCENYELDASTIECETCTNVVAEVHLGITITICNDCGKMIIT